VLGQSHPSYLLAEWAVDSPAYWPVWWPAYSEALAALFPSPLSQRLKAIPKPPLRAARSFWGGLLHRAQVRVFPASWLSHCFPKEQKPLLDSTSEKHQVAKDAVMAEQRAFPASSQLPVEWRLGYIGPCAAPAAL
jgi:hypothetical protein